MKKGEFKMFGDLLGLALLGTFIWVIDENGNRHKVKVQSEEHRQKLLAQNRAMRKKLAAKNHGKTVKRHKSITSTRKPAKKKKSKDYDDFLGY
jgi:hypothetical protein